MFRHRDGARTPGFRVNLLLAAGSLTLSVFAAEAALRWSKPWLLPNSASHSPESGLLAGWLENRQGALRGSSPDLVFIGDSFVETGDYPDGWIALLRRATGRRIAAFGAPGACPSQYWFILDSLRRARMGAPAVVLLYVGNDFRDEAIWADLGADHASYQQRRWDLLTDISQPTFWPCSNPPGRTLLAHLRGTLARHSALYRAAAIARRSLSRPQNPPRGDELVRLMAEGCAKAPWAERAKGRVFFFQHHDATVRQDDPVNARARAAILRNLAARSQDLSLSVAVVLDREENCAAVHGRPIARAASFIDEVRSLGIQVLDANAEVAAECADRDIYLTDGHWNRDGHRAFAGAMERLLVSRGLLTVDPRRDLER